MNKTAQEEEARAPALDGTLSAVIAADRLALSEATEGKELLRRRLASGSVPNDLDALVVRCLAKDPERRPTARELSEELAAFGGARAMSSGPELSNGSRADQV